MRTRSVLSVIVMLATSCAPSLASAKTAKATTMPTCAVADQVVMVDTATKTYRIREKSSTATSIREKGRAEVKANAARIESGLKPMCKSKADAMGAKMVRGAMKS